jgi:two-component sensor histidine kinase
MALIHENLYRSEDLARINFGPYLRALIRNAMQFYDISSRFIKTTVDSHALILTISQAIPCGLIINEFITNSLKYAFPADREGEILISARTENKRVIINYQDNGVGLPTDLDWQNSNTLGLKLVKLLVKQLHGNIALVHGGKTEFQIEFGWEGLD